MADYTTPKSSKSGIGLVLAAAFIVAVLVYAIYAGSGGTDGTADPAAINDPAIVDPAIVDPAATPAPLPDSTQPTE